MDDEEGDFSLNATARSRLSSLFQSDNSGGDVNQALTFTAPKQPRKNGTQSKQQEQNAAAFKLLYAGAAHAYKLKDGNYTKQGKLGCAILGLHENASYRFLLYKGKQIQVTTCLLVPSFNFHVQPNNYVNFYDDKNENWSINFKSEEALIDFAKQIALAKANSEGKNLASVIIQDLVLGDGPSLDSGDTAEIRYTGWVLSNNAFGQVFENNMKSETPFRLRIGKSKIIKGLSEGLVGAKKGSRRLLIIPPNLISEGASPSVPSNSTVIFEIFVNKVKISRESSHSPSPSKVPENVPERKPEVLPRPSISQEDNIRMRGASISEQLSQSPKKDKAQLISRMAKMGTATLLLPGAIPVQVSSSSEDEEEIPPESPPVQLSNSRTESPKSFSKPNSRKNSGSSSAAQPIQMQMAQPQPIQESVPMQVTQHSSQITLHSQATLPSQQPFMAPSAAMPFTPYQTPFQPQFPMTGMPSVPTSIADTHLPMLITETRNQNTEVRLSLSKITDKVDMAIQKIDDLRLLQGRVPALGQAPYMDSAMLVQNIERIVQENKQLKDDVETKNSKIQSLNEKICDLFQRNQRFFEESNSMLEQKSDSIQAVTAQSQAKLSSLENEKAKLSSDLLNATSKLTSMETELNKLKSLESQLKQKLLEYEKEAEMRSVESSSERESILTSLRQQVKSAEAETKILTQKLDEQKEQCDQLLETKAVLEKLVKENELKVEEIKSKTEKEVKEKYEKEIRQYQEKLQQIASASEKDDSVADMYKSELQTLKKEKEELIKERDELFSKTEKLEKTSEELYKKKINDLQTELENSLAWKKKYENFYERTRAMKEKYDGQINELVAEIKQLTAVGSAPVSSDFSGEIKKVMNALFKMLQGKFEANSSYPGSKVLELTLQSIRLLTFQMLEMKSRASSSSSEQDAVSGKESSPIASNEKSNIEKSAPAEPNANVQTNTGQEDTPVAQQNGLDEPQGVNEGIPPVSESSDKYSADNSKVLESDTALQEASETKSEKENECDQNSGDSNPEASKVNNIPKVEEPEIHQKDSKNVSQVSDVANRASPESSQLLSSGNEFADLFTDSGGSKV